MAIFMIPHGLDGVRLIGFVNFRQQAIEDSLDGMISWMTW